MPYFWTYFVEFAAGAKICATARQKSDFYSYLEYSACGHKFIFSIFGVEVEMLGALLPPKYPHQTVIALKYGVWDCN